MDPRQPHHVPQPQWQAPPGRPAPQRHDSGDFEDDRHTGKLKSRSKDVPGGHEHESGPHPSSIAAYEEAGLSSEHVLSYLQMSVADHPEESHQMRQSMRESRDGRGEARREPPKEARGSGWSKVSGFLSWGSSGANYEDDYQDSGPHNHHSHEQRSQRTAHGEPDPRIELQWFRSENAKQSSQIEQLKKDLMKEKATNDKVKLSADRMQLAMDNKELFVGVQLTDDAILQKFKNLLSQFKTWSTKFNKSGAIDVTALDEQTVQEFEAIAPGSLVPKPSRLWNSGKSRKMLIRGWVSFMMIESIFRVRTGIPEMGTPALDRWMGNTLQSSIANVEERLSYAGKHDIGIRETHSDLLADRAKVSLREFHDWRALTIELLSRIELGKVAFDESVTFVRGLSKRVIDTVGIFAAPEARQELGESIFQIFKTAVQFSQLLRRQRACWSVRGPEISASADAKPPRLMVFDKATMKDDDDIDDGYGDEPMDRGGKLVDLFIAPGLFKRGDADGERYETESCIVPALVLCKEQ